MRDLLTLVGKQTAVRKLALATMLAVLATLPQSASAQVGQEDASPESNLQEPASSSEPASEEPVLEIELTPIDIQVVPRLPRTVDGYTFEQMELRVKRAKIGIGVSAAASIVGVAMVGKAVSGWSESLSQPGGTTESEARIGYTGAALLAGGVVGMIVSGALLHVRKRKLHSVKPPGPDAEPPAHRHGPSYPLD